MYNKSYDQSVREFTHMASSILENTYAPSKKLSKLLCRKNDKYSYMKSSLKKLFSESTQLSTQPSRYSQRVNSGFSQRVEIETPNTSLFFDKEKYHLIDRDPKHLQLTFQQAQQLQLKKQHHPRLGKLRERMQLISERYPSQRVHLNNRKSLPQVSILQMTQPDFQQNQEESKILSPSVQSRYRNPLIFNSPVKTKEQIYQQRADEVISRYQQNKKKFFSDENIVKERLKNLDRNIKIQRHDAILKKLDKSQTKKFTKLIKQKQAQPRNYWSNY